MSYYHTHSKVQVLNIFPTDVYVQDIISWTVWSKKMTIKFLELIPTGKNPYWDETKEIDPDDIPIPYWLKQTVDHWNKEYWDAVQRSDFDWDDVINEGKALAHKIKHYMPDCHIVYFDLTL